MSTDEFNENEDFESQDESYEPDYEEEQEEEQPKKKSRVVLILAVLTLAGLNAFLFFNIHNQTKEIEAKNAEIRALDSNKTVLLAKVDALTNQIASLETGLTDKDASIANLMEEINGLKEELSSKDSKINSLAAFQRKFKEYEGYKTQAAEKEKEIEQLKADLEKERDRATTAENVNDTLTQLINDFKTQQAKLENKVNLGAKLLGNINGIISMSEKRGKTKETNKASQVSKIQVKYSIAANPIATKGTKTIYLPAIESSELILGPLVDIGSLTICTNSD